MNYLTFFLLAAGPMRNGWYNWAELKEEETKTLIDTLNKSMLNLTSIT
jgi:hypothetical protein